MEMGTCLKNNAQTSFYSIHQILLFCASGSENILTISAYIVVICPIEMCLLDRGLVEKVCQ